MENKVLAARAALVVAVWLGAAPAAPAAATITYQGRITSATGAGITQASLSVRLYDGPSAMTAAVTLGPFAGVTFTEGVFSLPLGLTEAQLDTLFSVGKRAFIEVIATLPDGSVVTLPRQEIAAAPYALRVPVGTGLHFDATGRLVLDAPPLNIAAPGAFGETTPSTVKATELRLPDGDGTLVTLAANPATPAAYTLRLPTSGGTNGQILSSDGSGQLVWAAAVGIPGIVSTADATAMTIDSQERVGIGITNPTTALDVVGTINASVGITTLAGLAAPAGLSVNAGSFYFGSSNAGTPVFRINSYAQSATIFQLQNNGTPIFTVNDGPTTRGAVTIAAATSATPALTLNQTSTSPLADFQLNGVSKLRIDGAGNVGIGAPTPAGPLDVGGGKLAVLSNGRVTIGKTTARAPIDFFDEGVASGVTDGVGLVAVGAMIEQDGLHDMTAGATLTATGGSLAYPPHLRDEANRWQAVPNGAALTIDIGRTMPVKAIAWGTYWRNQHLSNLDAYTIEHSLDGTSWTNWTTYPGPAQRSTLHVLPAGIEMRFVRITHNGTHNGYIANIQVLGYNKQSPYTRQEWGFMVKDGTTIVARTRGGVAIGTTATAPFGGLLTAGDVGVGTPAPAARLAVMSSAGAGLTGSVSVAAASTAVTGTGTLFRSELAVGDAIRIGAETLSVAAIASDTALTLAAPHTAGATGADAHRDRDLFTIDNAAGARRVVVDKTGRLGVGAATPHSALQVGGAIAVATRSFAVSTQLTDADHVALSTAPSADVTLPSAVGIAGRVYTIKYATSTPGGMTVHTTGGQTIDGQGSYCMGNPYDYVTVVSDGANWSILAYKPTGC